MAGDTVPKTISIPRWTMTKNVIISMETLRTRSINYRELKNDKCQLGINSKAWINRKRNLTAYGAGSNQRKLCGTDHLL